MRSRSQPGQPLRSSSAPEDPDTPARRPDGFFGPTGRLWIPAVLAFAAQVPAALGMLVSHTQTPLILRVLGAVFAVIAALSLLGARRWPGPVAVVSVAATVGCLAILGAIPGLPLAAAFGVASAIIRHARVWAYASAAGGWLMTAGVLIVIADLSGGEDPGRAGWWGPPWAGRRAPGGWWPVGTGPAAWWSSAVTIVLLTIGCVLVIAVAERVRVTRDRAEQQRMAERERRERGEQEERVRIARELHDVIAHSLSQISVQAGMGLHLMDAQPERAREALTNIRVTSRNALDEVRGALGMLRGQDTPVTPGPSMADLDPLIAGISGVQVSAQMDAGRWPAPANAQESGSPDAIGDLGTAIPAALQQAVYRIVQEALTNVVRHSHASHAQVRVGVFEDRIEILVEDNGVGMATDDAARTAPGNGLVGMRERAELLGGSFTIGAAAGGGTRVSATLLRWP